MPFQRIRNKAGEKENEDEEYDDGAEIVETVSSVFVPLAHVTDEQNFRQFALNLVMDGACYTVRTRLNLTDFEAQQTSTRLDVDQKAAIVH